MKLVVFRGEVVETEVPLRGLLKIGRDSRNDVVLDDPQKGVSRFHCEIRAERGRFVIVDMKSRNGIYVGGKRIRSSVEFTLGVPVIVGPFELMLEDDVASAGLEESVVQPVTSVGTSESSGRRGPRLDGRSSTGFTSRLPAWLRSRQTQVWGTAAGLLVLLGGLTWMVVRNVTAPVVVEYVPPEPPPPPPVDPDAARQEEIQSLLVLIENTLNADVESARSPIARLRELDPTHPQLAGFEERLNVPPVPPAAPVVRPPKPVAPTEPENPEFPRNAGEVYSDYLLRIRRVESNFRDGVEALGREEYTTARTRFANVQRDRPGFRNVEQLLADATEKQRVAFTEAIEGGEKNEAAGLSKAARVWYDRAIHIDPGSARAIERLAAVEKRLFAQAQGYMDTAGFHAKSGNKVLAARNYEQAKALLKPGDELSVKADRELEALKR